MNHFCEVCGVRVDAPGKCPACDPKSLSSEPVKAAAPIPTNTKPESAHAGAKAEASAPRKG